MNNYYIVTLIDGILDRLYAVAPKPELRHGGPTQWLYLAEPKTSFEVELVRSVTVLSDPLFPPAGTFKKGVWISTITGLESVTPPPPALMNGTPLPRPRQGQTAYSVEWRVLQALSGLRAVLLVLMDSCSTCALDSDYIGHLPLEDSLSVLQEMSSWSESDFVPNAKYWKDWPLARFLRNDFPPIPSSWKYSPMESLFSGPTGQYYRRLATYDSDRDDSFVFYRAVFGISQSKRGFAQVPVSFVKKSFQKHSAQLSTPPTSDPDLSDLRIFTRTFFEGFRCPRILTSLPSLEGSRNASVEASRFEGGARSVLRGIAAHESNYFDNSLKFKISSRIYEPDLPSDDPLVIEATQLLAELPLSISGLPSVDRSEPLIRMFEPVSGQVFEERGVPPLSTEGWKALAHSWTPEKSRQYLHPKLQIRLDSMALTNPLYHTLPLAKVAEVLEPLKVRLITAMDAVRTHFARPLQGALWRYLRSSPVFKLIGETISESLIHSLVDRHRRNGGGEDPFVSGDYSAATDGLDIRVSKEIMEIILDHLHPDDQPFREFIGSILYEQVLLYPKWTEIEPTIQKNGQLMGSVLSFPILCLANFFAYIKSLPNCDDILRSRKLMDRCAVLINGDDILFRSSESHYSRWLREISDVGFKPSVGKNFRHPRFFTVNSVPIEYRKAPTPFQFWRSWNWADMEESTIPWLVSQVPSIQIGGFLNVGLLTGQSKLTGRADLAALPLSGWHAGSVLVALNPAQAHRWFLKYHRSEIESQTRFGSTTLNIFAHPLLGGLGFVVPPGVEPRFSPEQRRIAQALYLSAVFTYEGQESEYSLDALLFLESETPSTTSLGNIRRKVLVEPYPLGTPLPQGYTPFVDSTGVQPLPMSSAPIVPGEQRASCRLSSSKIRSLIKRFGPDTVDLHPLDQMTLFPFTPVKVTRSSFRHDKTVANGLVENTLIETPFIKVYSPEIPHQDISVPIPAPMVITPSEPEDWETQDITLVLTRSVAVVPSSLPPPLSEKRLEVARRKLLEREAHARNSGVVYKRTPFEESLS